MTTLQKEYKGEPFSSVLFGNRKAIDVYQGMQFRAGGKSYEAENVYVKFYPKGDSNSATVPIVRINVGYVYFQGLGTAPAWFEPCSGIEWCAGTKGVGMKVKTPDGRIGVISVMAANRVCWIKHIDSNGVLSDIPHSESYKEDDLIELTETLVERSAVGIDFIAELKKYGRHLPNCSLNQNWDEAFQAMADTPNDQRDADYYVAMQELESKRSTCTCGFDKLFK